MVGTEPEGLDPAELNEARARALVLLGGLLADGPTPDTMAHLRAIPSLTPHLPAELDPDEAAAMHYHVYGRQVLPYESVFLSPEATLGGAHTQWWAEQGAGDDNGLAADHVGCALRAIGAACRRGDEKAQQAQAGRLLSWLPVLTLATEETGAALYCEALRTSAHILEQIGVASPPILPPAPDPLARPEAGLKHISRHLSTPVFLGAYLGPATLNEIGQSLGLPTGFGSRADVLENLFHAAAHYGQAQSLMDTIDRILARWQHALAERFASATVWVNRLAQGRAVLHHMQQSLTAPR